MRRVLRYSEMDEVAGLMDEKVFRYIDSDRTESFESFENFSIFAFDWYDIQMKTRGGHKILVYIDRDDLLIFCSDDASFENSASIFNETDDEIGAVTNGQCLYRFFTLMLRNDMNFLDEYEMEITDTEDELLSGKHKDCLQKIIEYRRSLLQMKRYYSQLVIAFDEFESNENSLVSEDTERLFSILSSRAARLCDAAANLRDYVGQVREAYQSQIDIAQNDLMKVFTVVTAVFLPLTLLVGWYGMNFDMPEFEWSGSYIVVICASIVIVASMLTIFKKKKYF